MISINCIERFSLYSRLDGWLLVPGLIILGMVLLYKVAIKFLADVIPPEKVRNMVWSKLMLLVFIIYPSLCGVLLSVYKCRLIEGKWWMIADLSLECYTTEWLEQAMIALAGILCFPIGVPLWCYTLLSRNRHKLFSDPKFSARFGFIYMRYEQTYWYWEITEMLRKFTLCGVIIFIASGTMMQLCFSIVVGAFFLSLHFKYQPYDDDLDDNLQTAALTANFLTLVTTILIKEKALIKKYDPEANTELSASTTAFLLIVNMMVMVTALYALVKDTIPTMIEEYMGYWDMAVKVKGMMADAKREHAEMKEALETAKLAAMKKADKEPKQSGQDSLVKDDPAPPTSAPLENKEEEDSELDRHIHRLFLRYDLDGSGTINSFDELEQLCCNLGYRLELDLNPTRIDAIIAEVKATNPNIEWDLSYFSSWFKETFVD